MPAQPTKYFTATSEPRNLYAGAALPDGSDAGLTHGRSYDIQNKSEVNRVNREERAPGGPEGEGGLIEKRATGRYKANQDSPLFVWTNQPGQEALLVISEVE